MTLKPKITLGINQLRIHLQLKRVKHLLSTEPKNQPIPNQQQASPIPNLGVEVNSNEVVIHAEVNLKFSRGKTELVDSNTGKVVTPSQIIPNSNLIQTIVQAEFWRQQLIENPTKSLSEIMKPYKVSPNYIRRLLNAAYLAPEIKKAIFQGTQPQALQVQDLTSKHSMDWQIQKKKLGFV